MSFLNDPFFWSLLSMFALVGAVGVVGSERRAKNPLFGFVIVAIFTLGRVILVLPFCPQPRLEMNGWNWIIGGAIFITGLIFCTPAFRIKPFTAPNENVKLATTGFYSIVRNPIYLGDVLWSLGWAIIFQSIIGILLTPMWWLSLLFLTLLEEESLERALGQPYLEYKKQVRGRIIPGLPF